MWTLNEEMCRVQVMELEVRRLFSFLFLLRFALSNLVLKCFFYMY
jgi:hypothetical protein